MKTHVWIKGIGEMQYAPLATLILGVKAPLDRGILDKTEDEKTYFANGIVITQPAWDRLREAIKLRVTQLDNMASYAD